VTPDETPVERPASACPYCGKPVPLRSFTHVGDERHAICPHCGERIVTHPTG
jgi:DNA-directed RNA polymerase subunit RPC12/RpoP